MATSIDYRPAGPVARAFHQSHAFVRGLMGPVGSGKSSASWMELILRAITQAPNSQGHRRTRWAVLRNTYPELKSTTIKTAQEWSPMMVMKWDAPISGMLDFWLPDKTRVKCEVYFMSLDRPEDVGKLKGLELTGAWLNEAIELPKQAIDMATQRVSTGRFPPRKDGGPTWTGVICDTNPPDTDHWWYKIFEEGKFSDYRVFKQPGGLIEKNGNYFDNPEAENIENLNGGYEYYHKQVQAKSKEWIKVFLLGQYGSVMDGKPVYPEYNDDLHCREIEADKSRELLIGLDYGLTPAAVICQMSPRGQLLVLDELCAEDMGISQFARDILKPHMTNAWRGYAFVAVGDPSGNRRAESDEKTCFMELAEAGIAAVPAISNDFLKRREAVAKYLIKLIDGKGAMLVHPRCAQLRKGFLGGYSYKRLQMAGEKYRDVAEKNKYSHCFAGFTKISTTKGRVRIDRLQVGDEVITPLGPRKITATMGRKTTDFVLLETSSGSKILCTPDHPFITPKGIVLAGELQYGNVLFSEDNQWADQRSTLSRLSTASSFTGHKRVTTGLMAAKAAHLCTAWCGRQVTALYRKGCTYITRITTSRITRLPIWSLSNAQSTAVIMGEFVPSFFQNLLRPTWSESEALLHFGTVRKKARRGTRSTPENLGPIDLSSNVDALSARASMVSLSGLPSEASAQTPARVPQEGPLARTTRKGIAWYVARFFSSTATPEPRPALKIVGSQSFRFPNERAVYDLTVDEAHCFYANGVLASNCHDALQYAALFTQFLDTASFVKKIKYTEVVV